jgi:hypothetical protein
MWKFGGLVLIAGCTTVPVSYDSNLLKLCEEPTGLRGPTGADVIFVYNVSCKS